MKSIFTPFSVLSLLLLIVSQANGQFTIQGEYRPRFEYRYGYSQLPADTSDPASFISQRTRLSFNYKGKGMMSRVTLQDVRVWGDQQLKSTAPTIGLYETWFEVKLHDSLSLRLGRQELIYDNERLMSNNDWSQSGKVHDAAVLKATLGGWKIDLGAAYNQLQENTFGTNYDNSQSSIKGNYKTMNFIWLSKNFTMFKLGLLGLADGFQKKGTTKTLYIRGTAGGYITFFKKDLGVTMRGFYQTGKTQEGQEIEAYYLNPCITWNVRKKLLLDGGMEYVSGNNASNPNDTKFRTFNVLYGTGHRFMGHMDYFTDMYRDTKGGGLVNLYLRTTYILNEKFALKADYSYFALQNNYAVNQMAIDKYLGSELDLNCKVDFSKSISLLFGYSFMLGTTSLEYIKGGDKDQWSNWAFVMLTLRPTFFNSEK